MSTFCAVDVWSHTAMLHNCKEMRSTMGVKIAGLVGSLASPWRERLDINKLFRSVCVPFWDSDTLISRVVFLVRQEIQCKLIASSHYAAKFFVLFSTHILCVWPHFFGLMTAYWRHLLLAWSLLLIRRAWLSKPQMTWQSM